MDMMSLAKMLLWVGAIALLTLCVMIYSEFETEKNRIFKGIIQTTCVLAPTAAIATAVLGMFLM